jgi:hypothetical protein
VELDTPYEAREINGLDCKTRELVTNPAQSYLLLVN